MKLRKEREQIESKLAPVNWDEGEEPSEDEQLSLTMRLREIELEL